MKSEKDCADSENLEKGENEDAGDDSLESLYALFDMQSTSQISIVSTNLPPITAEKLELVLLERLKIHSSDASISNNRMFRLNMESGPLSCHYHILNQTSLFTTDSKASEFIHVASHNALLIVLASPWEGLFELFSVEVERLFTSLQTCSDKKIFMEDLQNWYKTCVEYVTRVVKTLDSTSLSTVLEVAMRLGEISVEGVAQPLSSDLQKLVECCSFNFFDYAPKNKSVLAVYKENAFESIPENGLSQLSQSWAKDLTSCDIPVKIRQTIEWYKLKGIQDLNMMKRHMKKAVNDYYELYEAYKFLSKTGYPYVLLNHVSKENDVSAEDEEIISTLQEYLSSVNI